MPSDKCLGVEKYFPMGKLWLAILAFLVLALQPLAVGYLQRQDRGEDELGGQSKVAIPLLPHPAA